MSLFSTIDPTAFRLGPLSIQWYALVIVFGIIVGERMVQREARRFHLDEDFLFDIFFWMIVIGFIGARLYYVLFSLDYYLQHPSQIIAIWQGGMAIYGGVIAGALTLWYFTRRSKISFFAVTDLIVPGLLIAQSIGRWGNFFNQEAHGGPVTRSFLEQLYLPSVIIEQMKINGIYYHPTFLYESLWSIVGVILMLIIRRQFDDLRRGELSASYLIWYGLGRAWIEGLRTDSLYLGTIRVSQLLSLILLFAGLALIVYIRRHPSDWPKYNEDTFEEMRA